MRLVFASLFLLFAIALATPNLLADFIEPLLEQTPTQQDNETIADGGNLELLKRQIVGCATGYAGCGNLNAPGLCCRTNQVCSADAAGHVACCPLNAACTGTIQPVGAPSTVPFATATTTQNPFATITSSTAQPSFIQSGAGNVRSTPLVLQLIVLVKQTLLAALRP